MHGTHIKIALLYGVSIINGKIHNDRMLLKHQCVLLYYNYVKTITIQDSYSNLLPKTPLNSEITSSLIEQ